MNERIDVSRRGFYALIVGIVVSLIVIWIGTLYIFSEKFYRIGKATGYDETRVLIPAVSLVEINAVFVYDHGMYSYVKKNGKNSYKVIKSYP